MKYVAYYRVSTTKQEQSGLGLEAQRETVLKYIRNNGNQFIGEFTEVESGRKNRRPQLAKAIDLCKQEKATLVIAKLDRLSRNVHFISMLMENKVMFVCCDMPTATPFTIHIFAALAEQERNYISERTKSALDIKRIREPDWKPGTNNLTPEGRAQAHARTKQMAREDKSVRHAFHFIKPLREQGVSYRKIASMLNSENYRTRTGKLFTHTQVYNIWQRFTRETQS